MKTENLMADMRETGSASYAARARSYWAHWLPKAHAGLSEPDAFYGRLGQSAADQVAALSAQLYAGDAAPAGESEAQQYSRRAALRRQAEELVLAELVYMVPEIPQEGFEDDPEPTDAERDFEVWQDDVLDQLVDGTLEPQDLTADELARVRVGLSPKMLELALLRDEDLRARGLLP